jgi:hypothetical protein
MPTGDATFYFSASVLYNKEDSQEETVFLLKDTMLGMTGFVQTRESKALGNRVGMIAAHMLKQLKEHEQAIQNSNLLFEALLKDLESVCASFREAFAQRDVPGNRIFFEIDADRSVGILNILWHTISFTTRGNTRPLALYRPSREPIFTGRIVALHGDFQDMVLDVEDQTYPNLLQYEIASLFVPADKTAPAVMKVRHLGDEEHYMHQADASMMFLLKTVEMICGGGFFHEKDF